jgi:3-hydroxy-3-methylglutaryl CoA synthase
MAENVSVGILAYGAYLPRLRLARKAVADANAWFNPGLKGLAKGERTMCNWDEDAVTMAVEAARDCLTGQDRGAISALAFASTSFPFEDRLNAGIVLEALSLKPSVNAQDLTASQRAATSGLVAALQMARGGAGPILMLASEKRRTKSASPLELQTGDGAAALLVGPDLGNGAVVARLIGHASRTVDFVDHFRGEGFEFDYTWEERWIRDEGYNKIVPAALADLFKATDTKPADIAHFAMPCVLPRVAAGIARKAGIPDAALRDNLHAVCGETGAAHPLVMLVDALEKAKPGEKILVVGFGQGCDALLFEATEHLSKLAPRLGVRGHLARRKEETNYSKLLAFNDLVAIERGMRAEVDKATPLSSLYRNRRMLTGFIGGQCRKCGTLQFPKSNVCVNPNCTAFHSQDDHPFADMPAKVQSYTADRLTYSPDPPHYYGMVVFEEGGRLMIDFTDCDEGSVDVAAPMRMMFRIKDYDPARGFTRYFWKAAPAGGPTQVNT